MLNENTKIQFTEIIIMDNKKLRRKIQFKQNSVKRYTTLGFIFLFLNLNMYYMRLFVELRIY
jgi:hypothetical protein